MKNATTTIKLTKEEAERIQTALNFYSVEYTNKKCDQNPDSEFWKEEWQKNLNLWRRFYDVEKRIEKKENQ